MRNYAASDNEDCEDDIIKEARNQDRYLNILKSVSYVFQNQYILDHG